MLRGPVYIITDLYYMYLLLLSIGKPLPINQQQLKLNAKYKNIAVNVSF